jgi:polyferredoxin
VLRDAQGLRAPLIVGAIGLTVVFLLTLIFGRFFCGYLCPAGAVQEIAYHAPVPKFTPWQKHAFMLVRAVFFILFLVLAFLFSASLLALFGIRDFFYLALTAGTAAFIVLLAVSAFLYRPFCRLVCPYGALLSLDAGKSIFRLRRTAACTGCKKCEEACPTDEAKRDDAKAECYLCGRCTDVCPVPGALRYTRHQRSDTIQENVAER